MLRFINTITGDVFSGVKPYVHWFDEGQSVNINYYKELVFTTNEQEIDVTIEDNPYFKLMKFSDPSYTTEILNGFSYYHIEDFIVSSLHLTGIPYAGTYLYRLFVYAFSSDTGEYSVDINIGNSTITVGADFYPENELLTNDLENLGVEIPMQIQKAIYESNVHEEAMDNILMNRKWKELLLEYWNIVACKGNYRSLINSMKFFEYGELLKIMEFWKAHYNKDIFISNDLEQILNDRFREQLSVLSKTTYMGLYLAMDKYTVNPDGTVPMEDDATGSGDGIWAQNNPKLYSIFNADPNLGQVASMWSAIDLSLKMTLVGNFFSTYFMPLHLDLIHSTIENVVFTNTVKILSNASMAQRDFVDLSGNFLTSVKKGQNYYIKPQNVYVTPRTILGFKDFTIENGVLSMMRDNNFHRYTKGVKFLGVDTELDTSYNEDYNGIPSIYDLVFAGTNTIRLFGAIVPIDVKIVSNVRSDARLKSAQINWVKDHKEIYSYTDTGIWIDPIEYHEIVDYAEDESPIYGPAKYKFEFNFNLMFTDPGTYHFYITFTSTDSFIYTQEFLVNILDDADNPIHIYKVERVDPKEYKDLEIKITPDNVLIVGDEYTYEINEFMLSQVDNINDRKLNWSGTEYICADIKNMQKNTGLNHVVMYTLQDNSSNATIDGLAASAANAETMRARRPDYWWFEREVYTSLVDDQQMQSYYDDTVQIYKTGNHELLQPHVVVTGISKYYTIESPSTTLYEKIFTRNSSTAKVEISQLGGFLYVHVIYTSGDGGYMKQFKLSDYVTFEVFSHEETVRVYPDYNYYELEKDSNGDPKGLASNKIKCEGDFYQLVDEDRFIPILHKLTKVEEKNCEVLPSELMVTIPELKRTYTDNTNIVWEFKHAGTMESITSYKVLRNNSDMPNKDHMTTYQSDHYIDFFEPLIGKFEPRVLTPGYYNINLNYQYAGEQHCESRDAAFKIRKGFEK